jgi:hypothetical protein
VTHDLLSKSRAGVVDACNPAMERERFDHEQL